jgi:hypothetical protein
MTSDSSDSESHLPSSPARDLWQLPDIKSLKIEHVDYDPPRKHVVHGEVVEFVEGIEILVETDGAIPVRALSPALYVGPVVVAENECLTERKYRFFVLGEDELPEGAPISLGWVGAPAPSGRTKFRYSAPRQPLAR